MVNGKEFIVTLTTHKSRREIVFPCLKSILSQDTPPDRVVVNISEEEFPDGTECMGDSFNGLVEEGSIELYKVSNNIMAFKKLIPTLLRYRDAYVMTADDDIIYKNGHITEHIDFLSKNSYRTPTSCNRCYRYNGSGDHGSVYTYADICDRIDILSDARLIGLKQDDLIYGLAVSGSGRDYMRNNYQVEGANDVSGLSKTINPSMNLRFVEQYVNDNFGMSLTDYRCHRKPIGHVQKSDFTIDGIYDSIPFNENFGKEIVDKRREVLNRGMSFSYGNKKKNAKSMPSIYY